MRKRRIFSIFLALGIMSTALTGCSDPPSQKTFKEQELESQSLQLELADSIIYFMDAKNSEDMKLGFVEGDNIPYIELDQGLQWLIKARNMVNERYENQLYGNANYSVEYDVDKSMVIVNKSNGAEVRMNWIENIITTRGISLLDIGVDESGLVTEQGYWKDDTGKILTNKDGSVSVRYIETEREGKEHDIQPGYEKELNLNDYGMKLAYLDTKLYMPLALFNNIFMGEIMFVYNGKNVFATENGDFDTSVRDEQGRNLKDIYDEAKTGEKPDKFANYNYFSLCSMLDLKYGLKEKHGITKDFYEYFKMTGMDVKLNSTDPERFANGMSNLIYDYLGEIDGGIVENSYFLGDKKVGMSLSENSKCTANEINNELDRLNKIREKYGVIKDGKVANMYDEIGDTAFLTIDSLKNIDKLRKVGEKTVTGEDGYYSLVEKGVFRDSVDMEKLSKVYSDDIYGLVIYANQMINRYGSPVKNVVLDVSCCHDYDPDGVAYVTAWILGESKMQIENKESSEKLTYYYKADTDLDKKITGSDSLDLDKVKVYCLTSEASALSASQLAAGFKLDGRVTLIGKPAVGGFGSRMTFACADGTVVTMSGDSEFVFDKAGENMGKTALEPDEAIRNEEHFYDRKWLAEYINSLA